MIPALRTTSAPLQDVLSGRHTTNLAGARAWAHQFAIERIASLYEQDYLELGGAVAA